MIRDMIRDNEEANYIFKHNGKCKGGLCKTCIVTHIRGTVQGCSNDTALEAVKKFLNIFI